MREETKRDFKGTLRKVAELGFDGVELAGYGGLTATELRDTLQDLGLKVAANHVPLADLETNLDEVIEYQKILETFILFAQFCREIVNQKKITSN
ncbi:hypothetical protein ACI2OX_04335 [Bacillus sp. N9]